MKPGSEIHNFREKELDYVRPELSHLNESWVGDSISHRLESAKQRYFDTVGQKMQTKAAPIREGVIVIKQETTMQELQQFAAVCKERFGIEAFQIHIHKDEGYMNAKQWTPNLHAHVVFDWTQPNGKSVRLSRDDMAELQTIASEALGMERGVSSDRKHLSAMQYKTECAKEQLQELSNDISSALDKHKDVQNQLLQLQKELRSIETKKNVQKLISKASEKFYGLIGKTVNDSRRIIEGAALGVHPAAAKTAPACGLIGGVYCAHRAELFKMLFCVSVGAAALGQPAHLVDAHALGTSLCSWLTTLPSARVRMP